MYDVAIIGAGPAGITAAIYCARYKLKTLLIGKDFGGYVAYAVEVGNYPGFEPAPGLELVKIFKKNIEMNKIDYKRELASEISRKDDGFNIKTNKAEYGSRYVIYALGTTKRKLDVPGEDSLKGIYHCATCDAPMTEGKEVVVVGGNNSGTSAASLISQYAEKVTLIEIMDKLPSEPIWVEKAENNPKIEILLSESVKEIKGESRVETVVLRSGKSISCNALFVEIGSTPETGIAEKLGARIDEQGCIDVGDDQSTSVEGLYAAGDVTNNSNNVRQIVVAQAEGAIAAQAVYNKML